MADAGLSFGVHSFDGTLTYDRDVCRKLSEQSSAIEISVSFGDVSKLTDKQAIVIGN